MGDVRDHLPEDEPELPDDDALPETLSLPDEPPLPEEPPPPGESMVERAKRRHGMAGAILAGGMVAIDQVLGRKVKEEPGIVVEASGEPGDIDSEGITVPVDERTTVHSPAHRPRSRTVRRTRR